jgi:glycine dehydrogenase subunit 1
MTHIPAYIPHTDADRAAMLAAIGVANMEDLFAAVPEAHRFPTLNLPNALSEMETLWEMQALASANASASSHALFLGAGAYNHYSPSMINHMLLRGEFYTAYTPYQPEMSQGTLQVIFEWQTMIAKLTGMDVANASHYDGATSLAEAVTVAVAHSRHKRKKIILSPNVHPHYRSVVRAYHQGMAYNFVGDKSGRASLEDLTDLLDEKTALFVVQYPDFMGNIQDFTALANKVHQAGALLCVVVNPIALGLLKPPGHMGADFVVGEGQSLGIPLSFGGPYVGFFACKEEFVRKIAGRIVGETVDSDGRRAYVMTLRPREQDIRREKALSNICTNQGLMALAGSIYLAVMGKHGLRRIAELCYQKAHYAASRINELPGYIVDLKTPFFHEFVVTCPKPVKATNDYLFNEHAIIGGYDLGQDYPDRRNQMLVAVTEMNTKAEIDDLVEALRKLNEK